MDKSYSLCLTRVSIVGVFSSFFSVRKYTWYGYLHATPLDGPNRARIGIIINLPVIYRDFIRNLFVKFRYTCTYPRLREKNIVCITSLSLRNILVKLCSYLINYRFYII